MSETAEQQPAAEAGDDKPKRLSNAELQKQTEALASSLEEQTHQVAGLELNVTTMNAKLDNLINVLNEMSARDRPTSFRQMADAGALADTQDQVMEFEGRGTDTPSVIETTGRPLDVNSKEFRDKAAELAFMNERLTISIQEVSDEDADKVVCVWVNGRAFAFNRGQEYEGIPRYVVYGLAKARPFSYRNEEYTKPNGEFAVRYPRSRGIRYPFSVIYDPNPRGSSWLQRALAEP